MVNNANVDKALGMLGLARRAGMLAIGEESTGTAARTGKAKVLFLAADASGNAERRAQAYAAMGAPLVRLPYLKEELSRALGKSGCSMAAVNDIGFACEIVEALGVAYKPPDSEFGEADGKFGELDEVLAELKSRRDRMKKRRSGGSSGAAGRIGMKGRKKV